MGHAAEKRSGQKQLQTRTAPVILIHKIKQLIREVTKEFWKCHRRCK
jgi:hypothetical protein